MTDGLLDHERVHDYWSYLCWAWALAFGWAALTRDDEVKRMRVRKRWVERAARCAEEHR